MAVWLVRGSPYRSHLRLCVLRALSPPHLQEGEASQKLFYFKLTRPPLTAFRNVCAACAKYATPPAGGGRQEVFYFKLALFALSALRNARASCAKYPTPP